MARRVTSAGPSDRAAAEAIYLEAFPPAERIPFSDLAARDAQGRSRVDLALEGDEVVGIASLAPLLDDWSLLEYIAVASGRRGGGIGAAIWGAVTGALLAERPGAAVLLEIENPEAPRLDAAERSMRERRRRFYTRLGARLLRVPAYSVPDATDPGAPALPMLLMAAPGRRAALPAAETRRLVADLYRIAYGLDGDDPLVRRALASAR